MRWSWRSRTQQQHELQVSALPSAISKKTRPKEVCWEISTEVHSLEPIHATSTQSSPRRPFTVSQHIFRKYATNVNGTLPHSDRMRRRHVRHCSAPADLGKHITKSRESWSLGPETLCEIFTSHMLPRLLKDSPETTISYGTELAPISRGCGVNSLTKYLFAQRFQGYVPCRRCCEDDLCFLVQGCGQDLFSVRKMFVDGTFCAEFAILKAGTRCDEDRRSRGRRED